MSQAFVHLFSALVSLERKYGLAGLDSEERAILGFIAGELAKGRHPDMQDVLSAELASRSTAYRKVANLKDSGLVLQKQRADGEHFVVPARLNGFVAAVRSALKAAEKRG